MARIFSSGFETGGLGVTSTEWNGTLVTVNIQIGAAYARSGDFGVQFTPAELSAPEMTRVLANGVYTRFVRFYLYIPSGQTPSQESHALNIVPYDGTNGTRVLQVILNANRTLQARIATSDFAAGTPVGPASSQLAFDTWYRIEARAAYGATGPVEVRVDGAAFVNTTANYTGGAVYASRIAVGILPSSAGSTAKVRWWCDDVAVDDAAFPGAGNILALRPNAIGSTTQWTLVGAPANWDACEEAPPDGDTSYVVTGVASNTDQYNLTDPGGTIQSVTGVSALYVVRGEGTTARTIGVGHRLAGVVWEDAAFSATLTSYRAIVGAFRTVTPAGGAWAVADLANLQTHQRHVSGANRLVRITGIFLMAEVVLVTETSVSRTAVVPFEAREGPAFRVKAGSFAAPGATGNFPVTGVGFQPKALILIGTWSEGDSGFSSSASACIGFMTGPGERFCAASSPVTTVGARRWDELAVVVIAAGGSIIYAADFVSFDPDGFTLNFSVASPDRRVLYVALGGEHLSNVKAGSFALNTSPGDQDITGTGFLPTVVLLVSSMMTGVGGTTSAKICLGAAKSATRRWAYHGSSRHALTALARSQQRTTAALLGLHDDGTQDFIADFVSFASNGFRLNLSDAPDSAWRVGYLALKGASAYVGAFDKRTTIGLQTVEGVGFLPKGLLFCSFCRLAQDGAMLDYEGAFGGVSQVGSERAFWALNRDDVFLSTGAFRTTKAFIDGAPDGTIIEAEADLDAYLADGFRLDWTTNDAVAKQILFVSFGDALPETEVEKTAVVMIESLLRLQRSIASPWESHGGVFRALLSSWEASSGQGQTFAAPVEALLGTEAAREAFFESAGAVLRLAQVPFEAIKELVEQAAIAPYEAGGTTSTALLSAWEALQEIRREGTSSLEALAAVAATRAAVLEALGRAASERLSPLETAGPVASLRLTPWEAAGLVASLRLVPWETLASLAALRLAPWEAVVRILRALQAPYEAAGRAASLRVIPYEAGGEVPLAVPPLQLFFSEAGTLLLAVGADVTTGREHLRDGGVRHGVHYTAGGGLVEVEPLLLLTRDRVRLEIPFASAETVGHLFNLRDGLYGRPLVWRNAFNAGTEVVVLNVQVQAFPGGRHFRAVVEMERVSG